ncbi:MAG: hypothetical protein M3R44_00110 [Candidatus Eremiobacteraeota bacterium]|nr:hypothetical protein [Candidatus Eremiobacteraeota bacterium]
MLGDWLLGLDPGYDRLRRTLRASLSIGGSVAAVYAIGRVMPLPLAATMLSGITAMLASMGAGTTWKDRLLTAAALRFRSCSPSAFGASFGGLAATIILPVRTRDAITVAAAKYLEALDETFAASVDVLVGEQPSCTPRDRSRALDRQLHDSSRARNPY